MITALDELIPQRFPAIAPGCVVLVAKSGKVIYKKAFGTANLESNIPMEPSMIFRIGSITKQFTAISILQLVEQGKIHLQDSVQEFIFDYPYNDHKITIENLLTHTSGIKDYMTISNPAEERTNYTPSQGVDYFKGEPLEFKPGSQFKYSNSNYYLLGYILEEVSGTTYAQYLQENIIDRAGLHNTSYIDPDKNIANTPQGYSRFDGKLEKATLQNITTIYAAGGLMSSAEDLFKWQKALDNNKLINRELISKAFTPYRFADNTYSKYGYGWFIKNIGDSKTIEHSGSTDGYQSDAIYFPNEDVFIVTLFNSFEQDMDWTVLSNDIAKLAIGKLINDDIQLKEDVLQTYAGRYIFNAEHQLVVTFKDGKLFIEGTNPDDRLPQVQLYAKSKNMFYIKEAELRFEFGNDVSNNSIKIVTYNNRGKDAEWIRSK